MLLVSWVIAGMSSGRPGVQGALVAVEKCAVNMGCWNKERCSANGRRVRRAAGPAAMPHQSMRRTRTDSDGGRL